MNKVTPILPLVVLAFSVIPIPMASSQNQNQNQFQTLKVCKQQTPRLMDRVRNWDVVWANTTSGTGGSMRADGRQIV